MPESPPGNRNSLRGLLEPAGRMRVRLQRMGSFLAAMVLPNIGAFIAWGLITALFIPAGWAPNPRLAVLADPMILYLLPLLIGFSGGRLLHGVRGGVVGAVATMGAVAGSTVPMFIAAMILGPLGGWTIRKLDGWIDTRVNAGFRMLSANFASGLCGMTLALTALTAVGPVVTHLTTALSAGARWFAEAGLLPLVALLIEPGKVMFMNNAINHGLLAPLGVAEVKEYGKSVFFLLETNPGPGLGLLLAYWIFGRGAARQSAPGAVVIQFLGGIHEIYFPYVLMNPLTMLAVIAGGISANFCFVLTSAGLAATPSPGSIFAEVALAPRGGLLPVLLGIAVGSIVTFLVAAPLVRRMKAEELDGRVLDRAVEQMQAAKAASKRAASSGIHMPASIVFACDAGMGSSVIGQSVLKQKLEEAGIEVRVEHAAVSDLSPLAEVVISHASLSPRVRAAAPQATVYAIEDFVSSPVYDEIVAELKRLAGR